MRKFKFKTIYKTDEAGNRVDIPALKGKDGSGEHGGDIPTRLSELTDDLGSNPVHTHSQYLTQHQSLSAYAKKTDLPTVPTNVSAFTNDAGYLTQHQSLTEYAKKSDIPTDYAKKSEIPTNLPNPNTLTLTGAVNATYDGSSPVTVDVPHVGAGLQDTGWKLLPIASGWASPDGAPLRIRRTGNVVFVTGRVAPTAAKSGSAYYTVATVPEGYRYTLSDDTTTSIFSSGTVKAKFLGKTMRNGDILVGYHQNYGDGTAAQITTTSYASIVMSYPTDDDFPDVSNMTPYVATASAASYQLDDV